MPARARELEAAGYDGAVSAEISSDPFLPLLLAAEHSERLELMTSIAVAFARNPMLLAQMGHDLNAYSKGRFILGLGSQIRPHITKRFSMPWSHPAARMRELILAMRAIWDCWYGGKPLQFRGEFYTHTLMTPMFTPTNTKYGAPRVFLAAVGPLMTEAAGEVADGLIAHAFTTERYLREVTLPAVERGLASAGGAAPTCDLLPGVRRDGRRRGARGREPRRDLQADRLLRLDSRLPARARAARLGRAPERAEPAVEARPVGRDGQPDRRRHPRGLRRRGEPPEIAEKLAQRYGGVFDRVLGGVLGDPTAGGAIARAASDLMRRSILMTFTRLRLAARSLRLIAPIAALLACAVPALGEGEGALTGRQIMERVDARDDGDRSVQDMEMLLIDKNGSTRTRKLRMRRRDIGEDVQSILFFLAPADVEDTGFLTHDYDDPDRDDDQWLYLPALKKTKRIATGDKSGSFMGSDFSYADMTERNLEHYDYRLLKEDVLDGRQGLARRGDPEHPQGDRRDGLHEVDPRRAAGQRRDGAHDLVAPEGRAHEVLRSEAAGADRRDLGGDPDADGDTQGRHHAAQDRSGLENVRFNQPMDESRFSVRQLEKGL